MLAESRTFSSFSVDDVAAAKAFYGDVLGLRTIDVRMPGDIWLLRLDLSGDGEVIVYPKDDHAPAAFTVLNFVVDDIDRAVDELAARGVRFERYDGFGQDGKGIARDSGGGPPIAWFRDPAGNVLSVVVAD